MVVRMTVGLVLTAVALAIAGRRLWWLKRLAFSGQPAPERVAAVREHPGRDVEDADDRGARAAQAAEVVGAGRGARGDVLGLHRPAADDHRGVRRAVRPDVRHPGIGHWAFIGFIEDLFAVGVLAGIITFTVIRIRNNPHKEGRKSRFFGSHTRAAWVVLGMIFLVIATLLIYRGAQINTGVFPYAHGAFASADRRRTGWRRWATG